MRRGPFSGNYWLDWNAYHGFILFITIIIVLWSGDPMFTWPVLVIAPITGLLNWLIDRSF